MANTPTKCSFLAFFLEWAKFRRWEVPACHIRACHWLENRGDHAVLLAFRGFSKSTLLGAYNAWRYWNDPTYRILHQGDQDKTAYKTARDTKNVLTRHPWTRDRFNPNTIRGDIAFWWVPGADDERNPSMQASGILSNITSSRADEVQNDDVEVPKNIGTPEAREKLRYRLSEQTFILVPGGRTLYVGTPHTHDSLYDEQIRMGAEFLKIPLFEHEKRIKGEGSSGIFEIEFVPEVVFTGIGEFTRVLEPGKDYRIKGKRIEFAEPLASDVDLYAGNAWPERFTNKEMIKNRRKCKTINEWDSQYQLHAKPITDIRLDPDRLVPYEVEPEFHTANRELVMMLGKTRIVSATARWDPASGKLRSDTSSLSVVFQDAMGRLYWHKALALMGDIAEFDAKGRVTSGQVWAICDMVERYGLGRIEVETNGIGGHAPAVLRGALKSRHLHCAVSEKHTTGNKNKRILSAFEPPMSGQYLWAHVDVIDTVWNQMKDWNPSVTDQPDDHLDSCAGAIASEPVRIGKNLVRILTGSGRQDWRPGTGVYEVEVEA